jgi:hypothetical protein
MHKQTEIVVTTAVQAYKMTSVPMPRMPSANCEDWVKFQRGHVPGGDLSKRECDKLQSFMKRTRSEAVTDGHYNYTVAGGRLAYCEPGVIS